MARKFVSTITRCRNNPRDWKHRLSDTFEVMDGIRKCATASEVCTCFLNYAHRFGATNLLAGKIPPPSASRREQAAHVLLKAWPEEWASRYFSSGYIYRDPTVRLVTRGTAPFLWSEVNTYCEPGTFGRRVMEEAAEFRLRQGFTLAFSTLEQQSIGFSVAGEKLELAPWERNSFQFAAACAFGSALAIQAGQPYCESVHLSPRQRDVLHWASEGLTVEEIAQRLNISINTADTHLRVVRERLGVTSTVHAVAEALRIGLIT